MNKFRVLIIGTNWHLTNMLIDFFEEEEHVEIIMSNLNSPTVVEPNMIIEPQKIRDIDEVKMQIAEKFLEWSEENGT